MGVYLLAVAGACAGALAGGAAGLVDGLWSWSASAQFLPTAAGKLRFLCYLALCYGFAGALVGVLSSWTWTLLARGTRLGDLGRALRSYQRAARERDPRDALALLSLTLASVPCIAAALGMTYLRGVEVLQSRKHFALVVAVAMALALAALVVGTLLAFALARPIEWGLRALARKPRVASWLSSPRAVLVVVLAAVAGAFGIAVWMAWDTLSLLRLRPLWITLVAALFAFSTASLGARGARRLATMGTSARRVLPAASALAAMALIVASGGSSGVRKAAGAYSGLGGHIPRPIRALADIDDDGYASILGGGDCDDWNADVHPGAVEIPDDGIDQNCVGGDVTLRPPKVDTAFVPVPSAVPDDLNILLITIDTLRADHMGIYGYERDTTPNIDALARTGAVFENGWAHAPSTRYSVPAILTGRYPLNIDYDHSVRGWPGLSPVNQTLAEQMKAAGLTTGAILNYWYFDRQRHMDQGFDHYDNSNKRLHKAVSGQGPAQTKGSSSAEQTDKALQFLAKHGQKRFFLWVHYYDPHFRYERHDNTPGFGDRRMDLYDHEIRFTDHHIGRLLDGLRQRGLSRRTAVVITGDHGEGFGEHGIDLHGYHLYAAQTKVPFIVQVPGLPAVRPTTPASHIDILPTLANLVGSPPHKRMMGRSMVDILAGQRDPHLDRQVFQQLSYENNNEMRAAASKHCHVIYNVSPDTSWEVYRIDKDPGETRDIVDAPGSCREVRRGLEKWYDQSGIPEGAIEALLPDKPDIAHPVTVEFGDHVRLIAVDLPGQPVKAGETVEIAYTFEALGRLRGGWKVFAHFEHGGRMRFQDDHQPPHRFSWWRSGQFIRYTRTVSIPRTASPGSYELWMGLFLRSDRQPARSQSVQVRDNRARVGSFQVVR